MYHIKGEPFVFKGVTNVHDCKTAQEVMVKAGLDWNVAICKNVAQMPMLESGETEGFIANGYDYKEVANSYNVFRTDNNLPLGTVKGRYTPVQNSEVFSFFDEAIGKDQAIWQTAGCSPDSSQIFVSAKLPNTILINGKDPVDNYLIFSNGHNGTKGLNIMLSPNRVACLNALNATFRKSSNKVNFRHTASIHTNIRNAADLLGLTKAMINKCNEAYNYMHSIEFTDKEARDVFANTILSKIELDRIADRGYSTEQLFKRELRAINDCEISMKKVNSLTSMENYYAVGPGQADIMGTGWGVYGAVTGYYSNVDNATGIKRMDSLLTGDKSKKIESTGNLILSF